jgi:hypothetical protein
MIQYLKNFFNRSTPSATEKNQRLTLDDLTPCKFLDLDVQLQNKQLVTDGYYRFTRTAGVTIPAGQIGKVDPKMDHIDLPIITETKVFFSISEKNRKDTYTVTHSVLSELFDFFESSLSEVIAAEKYSLNLELRNHLSQAEQDKKRSYARGFFNDVFKSFIYEKIALNEPIHQLPSGVESTNLLSKVWMYEYYLKNNMFLDQRELILRFLYCKKSLQVSNIHVYHNLVQELVRFCARRDMMIDINNSYNFESNHPYTFIHSRGLVYENHTDLFKNETDFNWMLETILNHDEKLSPKFCNRLAKVLNDEGSFQEKAKFNIFCTFLNQNFDAKLTKVRPDEAADSEIGKQEVENFKRHLKSFRENRN